MKHLLFFLFLIPSLSFGEVFDYVRTPSGASLDVSEQPVHITFDVDTSGECFPTTGQWVVLDDASAPTALMNFPVSGSGSFDEYWSYAVGGPHVPTIYYFIGTAPGTIEEIQGEACSSFPLDSITITETPPEPPEFGFLDVFKLLLLIGAMLAVFRHLIKSLTLR